MAVIEARGLSKSYGGKPAVSGLSFRSESAVMLANPPIAIGVTVASAPPVIMMSASPYWMVLNASPIA